MRSPPIYTRTATLVSYMTLFRSARVAQALARPSDCAGCSQDRSWQGRAESFVGIVVCVTLREIFETRVHAEKCGLHDPERAVTLLGNDDLRLALVRRLFAIELRIVVDLVAVDHQHEIGVLFDTAGLTQIRRSEEHTSELPVTNAHSVCRILLEK